MRLPPRALMVAAVALAAVVGPSRADYKEPSGVRSLFPHGIVKRIATPGKSDGYLFKTFREPVLVATRERSQLAMIWNGVDDKQWSYVAILSALLRRYCGISDGKFAKDLIDKTYKSAAEKAPGGSDERLLRQSAVASGCKVTVEVDGDRWHKLTTTFEPAK